MKYSYLGPLSQHISALITQKNALGFPYYSSQWILKKFDDFCMLNFSKESTITQEMGLSWAERKSDEAMKTLETRIAPVRELARYMNRTGIKAYVIPPGLSKNTAQYRPHIFTKAELSLFFNKLDGITINPEYPIRHLIYPVLFRLLYSCGFRPIEAVSLTCDNVDLKTGTVRIEESKGHRGRIVVVSDDMLALLSRYYKTASAIKPLTKYFFPNIQGKHYCVTHIGITFKKYWKLAEIPKPYGNKPRVYDFRHSFATKKLSEWQAQGKDVTSYLSYLSAYMGHAHLSATMYYIHLVPEFFPSQETLRLLKYDSLIPEV